VQALVSSLQALASFVLEGQELVLTLVAWVKQVLALSKFLGLGLNFGQLGLGLNFGQLGLGLNFGQLGLGLQEWVGKGLKFSQVPKSFDAQMKALDQMRKGRALELLQILLEQYDGMNQIH